MSFPMGSLVSDDLTTGSIKPLAESKPKQDAAPDAAPDASPLSAKLSAEDWRRAKSAMAVALDPVGNGAVTRWDNPETGANGAFTPLGQPYVKADLVCRDFVASVAIKADTSFVGTACRPTGGEWQITSATPRARL